MAKLYKCPVCNKEYANLIDLARCIERDDALIKANEKSKKVQQEKDEKEIMALYQTISEKISAFNTKYPNSTFSFNLRHSGDSLVKRDSGKEPDKTKAKSQTQQASSENSDPFEEFDLEDFLNTLLQIR